MAGVNPRNSPKFPFSGLPGPEIPRSPFRGAGFRGYRREGEWGGVGTDPITCTTSYRAQASDSTHAGQPPAPAAARASFRAQASNSHQHRANMSHP